MFAVGLEVLGFRVGLRVVGKDVVGDVVGDNVVGDSEVGDSEVGLLDGGGGETPNKFDGASITCILNNVFPMIFSLHSGVALGAINTSTR